ncbi:MAG: hypothetical protein LBI55_00385 [Oscillospiraceae bacterium]|jgi:inorganic pyrophosphatase|nr:hypothetical protein [Oscillospiraceae bacterium]
MILENFWLLLDNFLENHRIVIDRPRGTPHPKYKNSKYPVDYGYIKGTIAADGDEIDLFVGKLKSKKTTGFLCSIDLSKKTCEIKILFSCSPKEKEDARAFFNETGFISCILIDRMTTRAQFNSSFSQHEKENILNFFPEIFIFEKNTHKNQEFWGYLQKFIKESKIKESKSKIEGINIGRLKCSKKITDAFVGKTGNKKISGIICTLNLEKKESQNMLLIDCNEIQINDIVNNMLKNQLGVFAIKK